MREATATTTAFGNSMLASAQKHQAAFTTAGLAMAAFGAAVLFGLKSAGDAAVEFEGNLTKMVTLVGLTRDEVNSMGDAVLGLRDTGKGPLELSRALYFLTSAGLDAKTSLDVLEASAKAAAIGLGDTEVVADLLASAINAYGSENLSAAHATDVLIATVREGKAEAADLAASMGRVLPVASAMGISFDEVGAAMASMTLTGNDASTAATQLRAIMVSLLKPGREAEETLAAVGLSGAYLRDVIRQDGLWAALTELTNAIDVTDASLTKVFPNVRALTGITSLLGQNAEQVTGIFSELSGVTGLLADAYAEWSTTAEAAQARFSASMETMKIGIGQVLLPAITGIANAGAAFADFIIGLPGPLKAVAVAMMLAAGSFVFLAGSTLLLLPRLAAVKAAMADVGIHAGLMRGSLMMAGRFIAGPMGIAMAVATAGLVIYASAKADAKARVDEFTDAIKADSGALGENTRAVVANRLEQDGALEAALALGIGLDTLVDAVMGDSDAMYVLEASLASAEDVSFEFLSSIQKNIVALSDAEAAAKREAEALAAEADAQGYASDAALAHAEALSIVQDEAAATQEIADLLTATLEALAGVQLSVEQASLRWYDSLVQLHDELKKGAKTLDITTQAGRDNRAAILDVVDAAIAHGAAVAEETGSVQAGADAVAAHIRELIQEAEKAGFAKDEIRDYIKQLNLTPKDIKTTLELLGIDDAEVRLRQFFDEWNGRWLTWRVGVEGPGGGGGVQHAGGIVGASTAHRLHGGGNVRGDEVQTVLQRGEFVINRRSASRLGPRTLGMLNRMHDGGWAGGSQASDSFGAAFFDRQFAKLEKVLDDAANLIRQAIEDGISRANLRSARELSHVIAERQRRFETLLDDAVADLDKVRSKMREFASTIVSGFTGPADLVSDALSAWERAVADEEKLRGEIVRIERQIAGSTDPENIAALNAELAELRAQLAKMGAPGLDAADMQAFLADELKRNREFAEALQKLSAMGLSGDLLAEFAARGPDSLPFLLALIAGGEDMVDAFGDTQSAIDEFAKDTGEILKTAEFGEALELATERLADLKDRMAEVMDRLGERLARFIEAVRAEAIEHKVDDLERALGRLVNVLNRTVENAQTGTAAASRAGSMVPAGRMQSMQQVNPGLGAAAAAAPITINVSAGVYAHERDVGRALAEKLMEFERRGGRHHPA